MSGVQKQLAAARILTEYQAANPAAAGDSYWHPRSQTQFGYLFSEALADNSLVFEAPDRVSS
jgi:hypothetical protein